MRLSIVALLLSGSTLAFAQSGWTPPNPPQNMCQQVEKNVRAIYVSWASGATETFAELRQEMRAALAGKGAKEERLKAIYEKVFSRVEANEFSPPKFPTRVEGHLAAKKFAVDMCKEEIKEGP